MISDEQKQDFVEAKLAGLSPAVCRKLLGTTSRTTAARVWREYVAAHPDAVPAFETPTEEARRVRLTDDQKVALPRDFVEQLDESESDAPSDRLGEVEEALKATEGMGDIRVGEDDGIDTPLLVLHQDRRSPALVRNARDVPAALTPKGQPLSRRFWQGTSPPDGFGPEDFARMQAQKAREKHGQNRVFSGRGRVRRP